MTIAELIGEKELRHDMFVLLGVFLGAIIAFVGNLMRPWANSMAARNTEHRSFVKKHFVESGLLILQAWLEDQSKVVRLNDGFASYDKKLAPLELARSLDTRYQQNWSVGVAEIDKQLQKAAENAVDTAALQTNISELLSEVAFLHQVQMRWLDAGEVRQLWWRARLKLASRRRRSSDPRVCRD